jgi:serine/threonine-protein kinase
MADSAGTILAGKYELLAPIGRGGMAVIWRARTLGAAGFSRKVAVKRLLSTLARSAEFAARFVEEARVVAELEHPNIQQVHDFDRDSLGAYFIVLEWVEGIDFDQYLRAHHQMGARTTWHLVAAIAIEILRALRAAHRRTDAEGRLAPIIHRDITPANVLVGVNGIVKLADFGLAKAMDRKAAMSDPSIAKGKVSYLAPEVADGKLASPSSDIYGLGIVMWEALTLKRLFWGSSLAEIVLKVRDGVVPRIEEERSDVPRELCDIVDTALQRDPARRFESADEMLHALTTLLRAHPQPTDATHLGWSVRRAMAMLTGS